MVSTIPIDLFLPTRPWRPCFSLARFNHGEIRTKGQSEVVKLISIDCGRGKIIITSKSSSRLIILSVVEVLLLRRILPIVHLPVNALSTAPRKINISSYRFTLSLRPKVIRCNTLLVGLAIFRVIDILDRVAEHVFDLMKI